MKRAFTLVELMIVIAVLGILGAVVIPAFQGHIAATKEAAAKASLHLLRDAIERYAARHSGVAPGHVDHDPKRVAAWNIFIEQICGEGAYLSRMPENPFNGLNTLFLYTDPEDLPETANGFSGWVYHAGTKQIKINSPGTDSAGVAYYSY